MYVDLLAVRGLVRLTCRRYEEARGDFREATAISHDVYGENHETVYGSRILELYVEQEPGEADPEAARPEVAETLQQDLGSDQRLSALILLAMLECDLGQLQAAEASARQAVSQFEKRCGGRTQTGSLASQTLGRILIEAGRTDDASRCLEEALQKRESVPGVDRCPYAARILESLARSATAQGQRSQAATFEEHAAAIRVEVEEAAT